MELGISPSEITGAAETANSFVGPALWLFAILAIGAIGRMVFVAWGDNLRISGLLKGLSGGALVMIAVALIGAGIFFSDRDTRAFVIIKQKLVDPFVVDYLERDSCTPQTNKFCVVVWEETGREIVVNWHDQRVDAHEIYGGYDFTLFEAPRPRSRPETAQSRSTTPTQS